MSNRCPNCQADNRPGNAYCTACGSPLASPTGVQSAPPPEPAFAAPAVVEAAPAAPGEGRSRRTTLLVGAGVALLVAGGAFVLIRRGGGEEPAAVSGARRLTADPTEQWHADFDGYGRGVGNGDDVFVVSTDDGDATAFALAAGDGAQRWEVRLDAENAYASMATSDGVVVSTYDDGDGSLQLLSAKDGDTVWETDPGDGYLTVVGTQPFLVKSEGDSASQFTSMRTIDLGTGKLGPSRRADGGLRLTGPVIVGLDDGRVQRYDAATLEEIGNPVQVNRKATTVAVLGDRVFTNDEDDLVATDLDGKPVFQVDSPVDTIYSIQTIGDRLAVAGEDGTSLVTPQSDGVEEAWQTDGYVVAPVDGGRLLAVQDDGRMRFLAAVDGKENGAVKSEWSGDAPPYLLVSNGVVITDWSEQDAETRAFDFAGTSLWRLDDVGEIGDGWVTSVEQDGDDGFTLTYLR